MVQARRLLQICPHDSAPFGDLIGVYAKAARTLGMEAHSVFLGAATDAPLADAHYLNAPSMDRTRALSRALTSFADGAWDLIVCHRYRAYWAAVRSALPNAKCVALAHEFGLLARLQRRLNRRLFAADVRFAGVSDPVAQELFAITGQYHVLTNAIDIGACEGQLLSQQAALDALGLRQGPFTVGVVGRLHYKKRPQLALQAFRQFSLQQPDSRLVFVGDGEALSALRAAADSRVHFAGRVPHARRYLRAFDVVLYPAVADAFGMVPLEAMVAGVPVVCAPAHGPGWVMGALGIYARDDTPAGFAAALVESLQVDRQALAAAGAARAREHFSVDAAARALGALV